MERYHSWLSRAKLVHQEKYDYSQVEYKNANTAVTIICPIHGAFTQRPSNHLYLGRGCPECGGSRKLTTREFIERSHVVHNYRYSYDRTIYINNPTNVIITCPVHGDFEQTPANHLKGKNCARCKHNAPIDTSLFVERSKKIHRGKYDYSKTVYINNSTNVIITCPVHGDFEQMPVNHLKGRGCSLCKYKSEAKLVSFMKEHLPNTEFETQFRIDACPNRRYDIFIPEYNLIIELDGKQHFDQVSCWESPQSIQHIDCEKMMFALNEEYSIIRVYQPDVWEDRNDWQSKLLKAIHVYEAPTIIYLHDSIYENHKAIMAELLDVE